MSAEVLMATYMLDWLCDACLVESNLTVQEGERGSVMRAHVSAATAPNVLTRHSGPAAGISDAVCGGSLACGIQRHTNADHPISSVVSVY